MEDKTAIQMALEDAIAKKTANGEKVSPEWLFRNGQKVRAKIVYVAHVLNFSKPYGQHEYDEEIEFITDPFVWDRMSSDRCWDEYRLLTDEMAKIHFWGTGIRVRYTWVKNVEYFAEEM